jgi:DNA-binding NarL/FixJ family response regulator
MVANAALPARTRILVADDHALMRAGLCRLLSATPHLDVVGEAADGEDAVALARALRPDLVLMDLAMPRLGGIEATRRIVAAQRGVHVLIVSQLASELPVEEALRAGARGYVLKSASPEELLRAVASVSAGNSYFSPGVARSPLRLADAAGPPSKPGAALSPREREILQSLAEGLSSREIASRLHVSPRTVDTHRVRIMKKLDLHKASQLVRFAIRAGLVQP